jgi:hypothetical protein
MSLGLAWAAGLLQGVAFLWPQAQPLAWVGIALLAVALHRAAGRGTAVGALALAALTRQCVALFWWVGTARYFSQTSPLAAVSLAALGWLSTGLLSQVPLMALAVTPVRRLPVRFWLPGAWALGELGLEWSYGFSMTQLLHSQWALPPMLRALAYVGWVPLLIACLYAAASAGEAGALRAPRLLLPAGLALVLLALLPPIPPADDALRGLGAVHLAASVRPPGAVPERTELLVWPESTVRGNQRAPEGRLPRPVPLAAFDDRSGVPGIAGLTLRTSEGYFNAAGAIDAQGRLVETRAKSVLVPVGEREFWGLRGGSEPLIPGRVPPLLSMEGRKVIPLICYEAFSRLTSLRGKAAGGEVLAVLASDLPLAGSTAALEQSLGAVILRAVEQHVPAVRASLGGTAIIVSSDGRVLVRSAPGTSGILTVTHEGSEEGAPALRQQGGWAGAVR